MKFGIRYLIVLMLFLASVAGSAAQAWATPKEYCADQWIANDAMRKHCLVEQRDAHAKVMRYIERRDVSGRAKAVLGGNTRSAPYLVIFHVCWKKSRVEKFKTHEFIVFADCLDEKVKARRVAR